MWLAQKYEPKRLSQVVGQEKVVLTIRRVLGHSNYKGGAFLISGGSGQGKTTLAKCIARYLGVEPKHGSFSYTEIDGHQCTVDTVRGLADEARSAAMFTGQWRVWVVNEAHNLTPRAVQAFLTLLDVDRLPERWVFIFTTTIDPAEIFDDKSRKPFVDRCTPLRLTNQGLCDSFARLVYRVAGREGLNGKAFRVYQQCAKNNKNSIRGMYDDVERGELE